MYSKQGFEQKIVFFSLKKKINFFVGENCTEMWFLLIMFFVGFATAMALGFDTFFFLDFFLIETIDEKPDVWCDAVFAIV